MQIESITYKNESSDNIDTPDKILKSFEEKA